MADAGLVLEVRKTDWKQTRFVEGPVPELAPGQVLFRVDRFALTANNITYALAGDMLGYWRFFPCEEGWGRIPVMGFADVIRSTHPEVKEGTRCFGFYPMGRHLVIQPGAVSAAQIVDAAPHRAGLAPTYAQYLPTAGDAVYAEKREDPILLMRGLFMTSFLADDFLAEQGYLGARSVLDLERVEQDLDRAGVPGEAGRTRARDRPHLGAQRGVRAGARLLRPGRALRRGRVAPAERARGVRGHGRRPAPSPPPIHHHFGDQLKYDCTIGATHWSAARSAARACPARSRSSSSRPRRS